MAAAADLSLDLEAMLADREMAALFISEAHEHLASIEVLVLRLEEAPDDRGLVDALYRAFHTIKGNALALDARAVSAVAHEAESRLERIRSGAERLDTAGADGILEASDRLKRMVDVLAHGLCPPSGTAGGGATAPASAGMERRPGGASAVKVDTDRLDALVDMVGELMILQAMIRENCPALGEPDGLAARQFASLGHLLSELQRVSLSMRMVPLDRTFHRMARAARDVSRASNKPVDVVMSGEATELDRHVVEQIADPLLHLMRNAIDHGVEDAAARARCGKPARARIRLHASHHEGQVCIEISDDGGGLDVEKIRALAVARGLVDRADVLAPADLHQLIFSPGFSTAEAVTDLSGRGVGMDVVRKNVEALGGRIDIRTAPGHGTTFSLKVPLTLAILPGVLITAGGERFVVPAHTLREALRGVDCDAHTGPGGAPWTSVRGVAMPLVELTSLVSGHPDPARRADGVVLVLDVDGRRAAVRADRVFGMQEFVVKPLTTIGRVRGFSGGAVLADGTVGLILDAASLFELIETAPPADAAA